MAAKSHFEVRVERLMEGIRTELVGISASDTAAVARLQGRHMGLQLAVEEFKKAAADDVLDEDRS